MSHLVKQKKEEKLKRRAEQAALGEAPAQADAGEHEAGTEEAGAQQAGEDQP